MTKRRRTLGGFVADQESEEQNGAADSPQDGEEYDSSGETLPGFHIDPDKLQQMVAAGLHYAYSIECTNRPIKKVELKKAAIKPFMANVTTPVYKRLFEELQTILRTKHGMELCPLPPRRIPDSLQANATGQQSSKKRKEQEEPVEGRIAEEFDPSATDAFMLKSILPTAYREVIAGLEDARSLQYPGLVSAVVMLVAFNDGVLSRPHLESIYRDEAGLESVMKLDDLLATMRKDRYVDWIIDKNQRDNVAKLFLLPRSKIEFDVDSLLTLYEKMIGSVEGSSDILRENTAELDEYAKLKRQLEEQFHDSTAKT